MGNDILGEVMNWGKGAVDMAYRTVTPPQQNTAPSNQGGSEYNPEGYSYTPEPTRSQPSQNSPVGGDWVQEAGNWGRGAVETVAAAAPVVVPVAVAALGIGAVREYIGGEKAKSRRTPSENDLGISYEHTAPEKRSAPDRSMGGNKPVDDTIEWTSRGSSSTDKGFGTPGMKTWTDPRTGLVFANEAIAKKLGYGTPIKYNKNKISPSFGEIDNSQIGSEYWMDSNYEGPEPSEHDKYKYTDANYARDRIGDYARKIPSSVSISEAIKGIQKYPVSDKAVGYPRGKYKPQVAKTKRTKANTNTINDELSILRDSGIMGGKTAAKKPTKPRSQKPGKKEKYENWGI